MKIISVVGARPNFMKIAPFIRALEAHNVRIYKAGDSGEAIQHLLVHTGQHYDDTMSASFFAALGIPQADINLGIGSGSHGEQVGNTLIAIEKVLVAERPDWVVVVGDVNATAACSLAAKKLGIKVAHIEAGLRSGDMAMPEEINRIVCDSLSDLLLTPDRLSSENLAPCLRPDQKVSFVGNIMIDTLEEQRKKASTLNANAIIEEALLPDNQRFFDAESEKFGLITLHRPSNVDNLKILTALVRLLIDELAPQLPLIWAVHPRTLEQLKNYGLLDELSAYEQITLTRPLGYHELLKLNSLSTVMLTDSGGLQEECAVLGTPCLTLRWNTERPITLAENGGPSILVGNDPVRIRAAFDSVLSSSHRAPLRPELWDGNTATRIVEELLNF